MKKSVLLFNLLVFVQLIAFAQGQGPGTQIEGEVVYSGEDVVFHRIDEHTWVGTGHLAANESLYLVEGNDKAVLFDAGTSIADLDKIVASITEKPVMLVATHVHPDHVGSIDYFPEIYINPADTVNIPQFMPDYQGEVKYLEDGEIIDLGGRQLEVVFTPGHTPGSTTFIDKAAHYGFSGDSFGSGNLLVFTDISTLLVGCEKASAAMEKYDIGFLYPGHYFGSNLETKQRVDDLVTICKDVLSGKLEGEENAGGMFGMNRIINKYGVRVSYSQEQ